MKLNRCKAAHLLAQQTDELAQADNELNAANQELEAFTYSASHDLRTPVRHVVGFANLAQITLKSKLNPEVEQHLGVIRQAADRMTAIIDAMLLLSRAGRAELHLQAVPLGVLAQQGVQLKFPHQVVK